jgi:glycosyltransferase involved in cell wall biosynthesis
MQDLAQPLITTVIPTYRRPKLLRRAISSALNQTFQNLQVCVYDNASGDETAEVVAEFARRDSRVKYFCHAENIGVVSNFNFGMKSVDTEFFSMLSDDDVLLPECYQTVLEGFSKFPDAVFSASATIAMTADGKIRDVASMWPSEGNFKPPDGLFKMTANNLIWTSVLFRKDVIDLVGELDLEVGGPIDYDYFLRIAARFPFVISRELGAIWVDHPQSSCALSDLSFLWPGQLKMIRNLAEDKRIPFDVRSSIEQILTSQLQRNLFLMGVKSIRDKNFDEAYAVAKILRDSFRQIARANLILFIAKFCEVIPFLYPIVFFINQARKIPGRNQAKNLQEKFGNYSRYLS